MGICLCRPGQGCFRILTNARCMATPTTMNSAETPSAIHRPGSCHTSVLHGVVRHSWPMRPAQPRPATPRKGRPAALASSPSTREA